MSLSPEYMETRGMVIEVWHAPTGRFVNFKAYLTEFSDNYGQNWDEEAVFGRMDEHQTFRNTKRTINIGWKILAEDLLEAKRNMEKISVLAQMQYPVYNNANPANNAQSINTATSIQGSPIFRLKFLNWVQDASSPGNKAPASRSGLVGTMRNFSFSPVLESGYFHNEVNLQPENITTPEGERDFGRFFRNVMADRRNIEQYRSLAETDGGELYAKEIDMSIEYHVLHTHQVGWNGRNSYKNNFPYGEGLSAESTERKLAASKVKQERNQEDGNSTTDATRDSKISQLEGRMVKLGPPEGF